MLGTPFASGKLINGIKKSGKIEVSRIAMVRHHCKTLTNRSNRIMSKLWELVCERCRYNWDQFMTDDEFVPPCPKCGSSYTKRMPGGVKNKDKAKEPYDYL